MLKHIHLNTPLKEGQVTILPKDIAHRLARVMRYKAGQQLAVFNGIDGLFQAEFNGKDKLNIIAQLQSQPPIKQASLYICIPKKETFSRVLRQATEMNVSDIYPLFSDHTVPDKLNQERCTAIIAEAAEQCERLTIPILHAPQKLTEVTFSVPTLWAAERQGSLQKQNSQTFLGVLVGPEGGFSKTEINALQTQENIIPHTLGTTILRTDTAVIAALTKLNI